MNNKKYQIAENRIQKYIKKCHYTYDVQDIIKSYLKYWVGGWYVSYTTKDVISKHLIELRVLTGVDTN